MTAPATAYVGADIFDGVGHHHGHALIIEDGQVAGIIAREKVSAEADIVTLDGGLICPGFVDLQVNGGGGVLFNDDQSVSALRTIASAHARLGATSILPTLITDAPHKTRAAIAAVEQAIAQGVAGIVGLHLEGPHLSVARKGAHDPGLIRPMEAADLALLTDAASRLPVLKMTLAPENVTVDQMKALKSAGVVISLGHSNASFDQCVDAAQAGVTCVTHLFNAMSQLGNREPGLVGAAVSLGALSAGLIADGVHVHPDSIRIAVGGKRGPGQIFLVSDAMAIAGSDNDEFLLNGRKVIRTNGRLVLEDGTLAGADLDLLTAVRNLVGWGITSQDQALAMATFIPAKIIGLNIGKLTPGSRADFLHINTNSTAPNRIWRAGQPLTA